MPLRCCALPLLCGSLLSFAAPPLIQQAAPAHESTVPSLVPPRDSHAATKADPEPSKSDPDELGVYHNLQENGVTAPVVIHKADPKYSRAARKAALTGICDISIIVDRQGLPQQLKVKKSTTESASPDLRDAALSLDQAALAAAAKYRFRPATLEGKPVAVALVLEVDFRTY